ncbi:unnamed protein product [Ectocarpus sp. 6 AP-2014]
MVQRESDSIVGFVADGMAFEVKDPTRLEQDMLPKYFRFSSFMSLRHLLNLYGFKTSKLERSVWIFKHPFFRRDEPELLHALKRKTNRLGTPGSRDWVAIHRRGQQHNSGPDLSRQEPLENMDDVPQRKRAGERIGSGKGAEKIAPPELQEILPLMLTFLDSRSWCGCLSVSHATHDAVRAMFLGLMQDGTRPEEGWTVPLDVLTLKTDGAGVAHLAANECGITISGELDNLTQLRAVVIPPPQSGFVSVEGQQYIATSPILRCRWVGRDSSQGPWTVSFPLEEEDGLSNPTEISQVLRRGDNPQDEWEVQTAGLKASTRHPSMQVEVTHFSDVMTADKLREIEKTSASSFYKRKRVWGTKVKLLFSRYVHVYNASSEAMTVLQVLPAVMESGRGVQLSLPVVGGGGGGNRDITIHDDSTIEVRQVAAWVNPFDGSGNEPPSYPAKFETRLGMKEMRVIPYTATGSRKENNLKVFPRDFFHCSAGYDYYLLQKMVDESLRPRFWEGDVNTDTSEERKVMDIVNR